MNVGIFFKLIDVLSAAPQLSSRGGTASRRGFLLCLHLLCVISALANWLLLVRCSVSAVKPGLSSGAKVGEQRSKVKVMLLHFAVISNSGLFLMLSKAWW